MAFLNLLNPHDILVFCFIFNPEFKNSVPMLKSLYQKQSKFLICRTKFQGTPILHHNFNIASIKKVKCRIFLLFIYFYFGVEGVLWEGGGKSKEKVYWFHFVEECFIGSISLLLFTFEYCSVELLCYCYLYHGTSPFKCLYFNNVAEYTTW